VSVRLTRPDALDRLGELVEDTQVEGLFEDLFDEQTLVRRGTTN
jgi:hypothetical protein